MGNIIGITGNICSGKTTALQFFEERGKKVLKTDNFLYEAYKNQQCKQEIVAYLSSSILDPTGEIDRLLLKKRLLINPNLIKQLWKITDQYLDSSIIAALENHKDGMLLFETAQLFEKNWDSYCKKTIFCYAPDDKRAMWLKDRAKVRDSLELSIEQALEVLRQQTPQVEKLRRADFLIYNSGAIEDLYAQCQSIMIQLGGN